MQLDHFKTIEENIAIIANAVQWHNQSSDNKDCHEYGEISVSKVTSPRIVFVAGVGCLFVMNIDFFLAPSLYTIFYSFSW